MIGIVGYGAYIPKERLKIKEIWEMWCSDWLPSSLNDVLKLEEKAVTHWDEDSITMGIEASKVAIELTGVFPDQIGAVYFGSGTNVYATNASVSLVVEALGGKANTFCTDCQFSGKSGTAAMQISEALVKAKISEYALAIGSDDLSRHTAPNDFQEYASSAGAAAFLIGENNVVAEIEGTYSYITYTPDFYRLEGDRYIKIAGQKHDVDKVGYEKHTIEAAKGIMGKHNYQPKDFKYVIFNQPDGGRLPFSVAKSLGFTKEQVEPGLLVSQIGDCGSASCLISLAAILDLAKEKERILIVSYGSGAGSDAFIINTTSLLEKTRNKRKVYPSVKELISNKEMIDYKTYLRMERKLIQEYV